jgi:hypothetical protein
VRGLSVRQPWAFAILNGKPVENRDWQPDNPNRLFRGRVLLHASKGCGKREYQQAAEFILEVAGLTVPPLSDLPRGAIVGAMTITGWVEEHDSPYYVGPGALILADVVALPKPIHCNGALGFFRIPDAVAEAVRQQVRAWKEGG